MEFDEYMEPDTEQTEDSSPEPETDTDAGTEENDNLPEDAGESGENSEKELTELMDELIDILTPEEPDASENEDGSESGADIESTVQETSDSYSQELLESINGTLSMIKSANVSYHAESLYYQEEMLAKQEHISACLELTIILLFAAAFFVALSAGCRIADTFFNRMRG